MDQESPPQISSNSDQQVAVTTVESNNFRHVLEYFNEQGHLTNPDTTRLSIPCGICGEKDLALLNGKFNKRSRETHESFAVLPICGHAFGYNCLFEWLLKDINKRNPICPFCRAQAFPSVREPLNLPIFGDAGIDEQHEQVVEIRESLYDHNAMEKLQRHELFNFVALNIEELSDEELLVEDDEELLILNDVIAAFAQNGDVQR
ncbi:hypothetical protein F4677DRAFT_411717 [Hypoxylon crocopeplum]|nr:hypothetical protein F4677DRAFT_411717 [Hypoxylon crocopeplum]